MIIRGLIVSCLVYLGLDLMTQKGQNKEQGPIRELLVAGGKDLQQRKKMLLENADGLGTY